MNCLEFSLILATFSLGWRDPEYIWVEQDTERRATIPRTREGRDDFRFMVRKN
jgi:hypothetical protein